MDQCIGQAYFLKIYIYINLKVIYRIYVSFALILSQEFVCFNKGKNSDDEISCTTEGKTILDEVSAYGIAITCAWE